LPILNVSRHIITDNKFDSKLNLKTIKTITILVSLTIFVVSLNYNAITLDFQGVKPVPSIEYFLMGSTAILGGGLLEWIMWLANPLSLLTIIYLWKDNRIARLTSIISMSLALIFSTWNEILGAESGSMGKIVSLEVGYYLWLTSIIVLTIGTNYYFLRLWQLEKLKIRCLTRCISHAKADGLACLMHEAVIRSWFLAIFALKISILVKTT